MNILHQILKLWLPTKPSSMIAGLSISLGLLAMRLPEFLLKFGVQLQDQIALLVRITMPLLLWLAGSLVVIILLLRVLAQQKKKNTSLETERENQKIALKNLQAEIQNRNAEINHLRQEIKSLNDVLHAQPNQDKFDPRL
jgi:HAMP domain-containing protein